MMRGPTDTTGAFGRFRRAASRVGGLFGSRRDDRELSEELACHLQLHIDDNLAVGMTPREARRQAMLALGGLDQTKEQHRDQRGMPMIEHFARDLRFGIRGLASNPGFAGVAILTIAVAVGANVSVFSLLNALLLRPLDIADPARAVHVYSGRSSNTPYAEYVIYRDGNSTLASLGAFSFASLSLRLTGSPEHVLGAVVSGNYFSTIGLRPALGRLLHDADDRPGASGALVVSHQSWRRRFLGNPSVIGRSVTINGHPFTLVGVLPPDFRGEMAPFAPELWIAWHAPSQADATGKRAGPFSSARLTGRLAAGRTMAEAQADLTRLAQTIAEAHPDTPANLRVTVVPATVLPPEFNGQVRLFLGLLMSLAAIVLVVGCLNLANLLMARWAARGGEIALRLALGAGRGRIVQQLTTESLLLSMCGGAGALWLAWWAVGLVSQANLATPVGPVAIPLRFDWRVMLFSFLLPCAATVIFGLLPALQVSRAALFSGLKESGLTATAGPSKMRASLMIAQLSLSTVLIVTCGLLLRSLEVARTSDRGFVATGVLAGSVDVSTLGYDERKGLETYARILDRVEALPGVRAASVVDIVPLTLSNSSARILKEGESLPSPGDMRDNTYLNGVTRGHFGTLGIPLVAGRDFTDRDSASAPPVGIVNQTMAMRFWPGENPVGKRVRGVRTLDSFGPSIEIVGVVRDSKYATVGEGPRQFLYRPLAQRYTPAATILVATESPAQTVASLRAAVDDVAPNLPLFNVAPLSELTELSLLPLELATYLSGALGATALTLAVIGLYGVVSFLVGLRRREIAIRIALGAAPSEVVRLVTREGTRWIATGLVAGLVISMAFAQLLAGLLYGVTPADPVVLVGATALLGATAYLSCRWPAQRTSRLDPTTVLREQ